MTDQIPLMLHNFNTFLVSNGERNSYFVGDKVTALFI